MATKAELKRRVVHLENRLEKLEEQLENNLVEREVPDYGSSFFPSYDYYGERPTKTVHELTIEGKVNAILEHLALDVSVEQRKTTTTGPKIKTKKIVKKGKK